MSVLGPGVSSPGQIYLYVCVGSGGRSSPVRKISLYSPAVGTLPLLVSEPALTIFTACKRSLRKENVFTHVCHSVQGGRGMCGRGHVLQGGMCGRGVCVAGGHVWWEDVCGGGHAWQGGMHDKGGIHGRGMGGMCGRGGMHCRRDGHCSGWYASYWNAYLLTRMHSSRMCTACLLPVSPGMHCSGGGGVYLVWMGVYLVLGVYLIQGGVPGPRGVYLVPGGCTGSWGVHLVPEGCTWSGGCTWYRVGVPGPRGVYLVPGGCTWSQGVYLILGGVPGPWGVPSPGGCTWSRGVYLVPGGVPARVLPPPRGQNHRHL